MSPARAAGILSALLGLAAWVCFLLGCLATYIGGPIFAMPLVVLLSVGAVLAALPGRRQEIWADAGLPLGLGALFMVVLEIGFFAFFYFLHHA